MSEDVDRDDGDDDDEESPTAEVLDGVDTFVSVGPGVAVGVGVITEVTVVPDVNVVPAVIVLPLVTTTTEVTTVGETMTVVFVDGEGAFSVFVVVFSSAVVELVVVVEVHSTPNGGKNPTQPPPKGPPKARWTSVVGPLSKCMSRLNSTMCQNGHVSGNPYCSDILTIRTRQESIGREAERVIVSS